MEYIVDLHTHTIASGHAYNTIKEMAQEASNRGIKLLGITEHARKMPGTCHDFYFQNLKVVPREMFGLELLLGVELNILDSSGNIDMSEKLLRQMDIAIASLHIPCIQPKSAEENTKAVIKAMENPYISVLGHPDDGRFPLEYEPLVKAARDTNTILEINNTSLSPQSFRENARENDLVMLQLCNEYGVSVIVNSDAHVDYRVGEHEFGAALLKEIDFPDELCLNDKPDEVKKRILQKRSGL